MKAQELYLISDEAHKYLKIGISKQPHARLKFIQAHCPLKLKMLMVIPGGRRLEYGIHIRLSGLSIHGEWYPLEGEKGIEVKTRLADVLKKKTDDFFV